MRTYCLETSVIIDYLRGKPGTIEKVDNLSGEVVSSYVCLAELYEGIYRVKNRSHAEQAVKHFFAGLQRIYGVDGQIAEQFGKLRANLKKNGIALEDMDIFIAATCLAYNLVLVTNNTAHFSRVPKLILG